MCLQKIIGKPEKTSGIGYKVYLRDGETLRTTYCNLTGRIGSPFSTAIDLNVKYNSVKQIEEDCFGNEYLTGFHILTNKKNAEIYLLTMDCFPLNNLVIVKVKYEKARIEGLEYGGFPCIIADEITLLEIL